MVSDLIAIVRAVWPYVKDSLLSGQDLRGWVKANKYAVLMIVMMVLMALVTLFLFDETTRLTQENQRLQSLVVKKVKPTDEKLAQQLQATLKKSSVLSAENRKLSLSLTEKTTELSEVRNRLTVLESWIGSCGVSEEAIAASDASICRIPAAPTATTPATTPAAPTCPKPKTIIRYVDRPVPAPARPVRRPPPVNNENSRLRERVRAVLGNENG